MLKSRDYSTALGVIVSQLSACAECKKSPFIAGNASDKVKLIVIAGDRGLAGGYNANVFREAAKYPDAEFIPIGKRACERYSAEVNSSEKYPSADAYNLAKKALHRVQKRRIRKAWYNKHTLCFDDDAGGDRSMGASA